MRRRPECLRRSTPPPRPPAGRRAARPADCASACSQRLRSTSRRSSCGRSPRSGRAWSSRCGTWTSATRPAGCAQETPTSPSSGCRSRPTGSSSSRSSTRSAWACWPTTTRSRQSPSSEPPTSPESRWAGSKGSTPSRTTSGRSRSTATGPTEPGRDHRVRRLPGRDQGRTGSRCGARLDRALAALVRPRQARDRRPRAGAGGRLPSRGRRESARRHLRPCAQDVVTTTAAAQGR